MLVRKIIAASGFGTNLKVGARVPGQVKSEESSEAVLGSTSARLGALGVLEVGSSGSSNTFVWYGRIRKEHREQ